MLVLGLFGVGLGFWICGKNCGLYGTEWGLGSVFYQKIVRGLVSLELLINICAPKKVNEFY